MPATMVPLLPLLVVAATAAAAAAAAAFALAPSPPPSIVGRFANYTNALPNSQLPHAPLLGNGALGVAVDAHRGTNALELWVGSTSMWSCGACSSLAGGCCKVAALGGLRIRLPPSLPSLAYTAEQRVAD